MLGCERKKRPFVEQEEPNSRSRFKLAITRAYMDSVEWKLRFARFCKKVSIVGFQTRLSELSGKHPNGIIVYAALATSGNHKMDWMDGAWAGISSAQWRVA